MGNSPFQARRRSPTGKFSSTACCSPEPCTADFFDDNGDPVAALPAPPTDGYYNVYVNGVLQEGGLSTLTTASLVLATTAFCSHFASMERDGFFFARLLLRRTCWTLSLWLRWFCENNTTP
ncbi:DUF4183 domain-containing protein [Bacillus sp. 3255]|uniref:DUF4183 domain-containing protein n=1 Tax=Bacillus sp. 3255 TaxID=2817904 RepID=UPI00286AF408|nr:DUF4183 domain-containing protein [Bacillus sp. 3255]